MSAKLQVNKIYAAILPRIYIVVNGFLLVLRFPTPIKLAAHARHY